MMNVENFDGIDANPVENPIRVADQWHHPHPGPLCHFLGAFRPSPDPRSDSA
jgi:hypothetical protein